MFLLNLETLYNHELSNIISLQKAYIHITTIISLLEKFISSK